MTSDPTRIEMLVMDVDGVLTDGSIIYDDEGRELKRFSVRDGLGIKMWLGRGLQAAVISSRASEAVTRRMGELGVTRLVQGTGDKGEAVERLGRVAGIALEHMAFIGDDLPDLAAMRRVGYAISVADADSRVRDAAAYVTTAAGGQGAVREAIHHLLEARGDLGEALAQYD